MKRVSPNDYEELRLWVLNDEGLYNWWKSSRRSLDNFIKEDGIEIAEAITNYLNVEPRN